MSDNNKQQNTIICRGCKGTGMERVYTWKETDTTDISIFQCAKCKTITVFSEIYEEKDAKNEGGT